MTALHDRLISPYIFVNVRRDMRRDRRPPPPPPQIRKTRLLSHSSKPNTKASHASKNKILLPHPPAENGVMWDEYPLLGLYLTRLKIAAPTDLFDR